MRGIQFINDNKGNRIKAVVDLTLYGKEFAAFVEELSKKYESGGSGYTSPFGSNPVIGDNIAYMGGGHGSNAPNTRLLKINALVDNARKYYGTPYRTGGTTASGMDCSGLTQTVFKSIGVNIPRVSRDQANFGTGVRFNESQAGDLIFFATGTPNRVNHVGVISSNKNGEVKFIHASSSRGVMESSMNNNYWRKAYMTARRVL